MPIVKIKDLSGSQLDYAVGKANGWVRYPTDSVERGSVWHKDPNTAPFGPIINLRDYIPTCGGFHAWEVIQREKINLQYCRINDEWEASYDRFEMVVHTHSGYGVASDPVTAALRCYVAEKFGDEIEIPEDICNQ